MYNLRSILQQGAGNWGARKQLEAHTIDLRQIALGQPVTVPMMSGLALGD